jgi:hypothetical protein
MAHFLEVERTTSRKLLQVGQSKSMEKRLKKKKRGHAAQVSKLRTKIRRKPRGASSKTTSTSSPPPLPFLASSPPLPGEGTRSQARKSSTGDTCSILPLPPRESGRIWPGRSLPISRAIRRAGGGPRPSRQISAPFVGFRGRRRRGEMKSRMKDMVRVATARLGGEHQAGAASSSGYGRRESTATRTARLGGDSLRRQPQPQAPTVRTVYCNDREANAPVGYRVTAAAHGPSSLPFHRSRGWISWV